MPSTVPSSGLCLINPVHQERWNTNHMSPLYEPNHWVTDHKETPEEASRILVGIDAINSTKQRFPVVTKTVPMDSCNHLPILVRVASLALGQSYGCPSPNESTLKHMGNTSLCPFSISYVEAEVTWNFTSKSLDRFVSALQLGSQVTRLNPKWRRLLIVDNLDHSNVVICILHLLRFIGVTFYSILEDMYAKGGQHYVHR